MPPDRTRFFLETLGDYAAAACTTLDASTAAREIARTTIFTAEVRRIVRDWPLPLLVAMAVLESPSHALNQAAQHARHACAAIAQIVQAIPDRLQADALLDQALQLLIDQREDQYSTRSPALGSVIGRIIARDTANGAAIDAVVSDYAAVEARVPSELLVGIAEAIADLDRARAARLLDEAERLAQALPVGHVRDRALTTIVSSIANFDPTNPDFVARALSLAQQISGSHQHQRAVRDVVTLTGAPQSGGSRPPVGG